METTDNTTDAHIKKSVSFGDKLKEAREKQNISIDDVSEKLKIISRQVKAIEMQDFSKLPPKPFVRGFVVNYARFLQLDIDELIADFETSFESEVANNTKTNKANKSISVKKEARVSVSTENKVVTPIKNKSSKLKKIGLVGLIIIVLLSIGYSFNSQFIAEKFKELSTTTLAQKNSEAVAVAAPQASDQDEVIENNPESVDETASVNSAQLQPDEPVVAVDESTANAEIEFWVIRTAEINVTDAAGKQLMAGVTKRGSYTVKGLGPFNLVVKKSNNVRLDYNKQPVNLDLYADENDTAIFDLGK